MRNKVILIIALLLLFSVKSIAQIQNTFFGNQFGSTFYTVKNNLERQGITTYSKGNRELSCRNIRFGGYEWDFCDFIFNNQSEFYTINLSTPFKGSQTAVRIYESLKETLQRKYEDCYSIDKDENDTDRLIIFLDDNNVVLSLGLSYGDSFHHVILIYQDMSYDTSNDEL